MTTLTPHALADLLRAGAHGLYATEAAAELLIEHRRWLERADFIVACVDVDDDDGQHMAWVDWPAVPGFLDEAACSTTEAQVLRLAAELAGTDTGVAVGDLLLRLDDRNGPLVVDAVAHVALRGRRPAR